MNACHVLACLDTQSKAECDGADLSLMADADTKRRQQMVSQLTPALTRAFSLLVLLAGPQLPVLLSHHPKSEEREHSSQLSLQSISTTSRRTNS
jgi:hypothetical protein